MKTFYLMRIPDHVIEHRGEQYIFEGREFISERDDQPHARCDGEVEACCWIEAKEKFLFDLTPLQHAMLADHQARLAA